jgi:hypothetical protein
VALFANNAVSGRINPLLVLAVGRGDRKDVPLTLPPVQEATSFASMEDLREQCGKLAEQLNQAGLHLTQQVGITLELVGRIAQLVSLHTEQAKQSNTLHRLTSCT